MSPPIENVAFKVAKAKPTPDTLLSTVYKLLGWTMPSDSTKTNSPLERGSVVYRHLQSNKLRESKHPHLSALLSFIATGTPKCISIYYSSKRVLDPVKKTARIVNEVYPIAPFSIPNLYYENGVRGYMRGILGIMISYEPVHPNSETIRKFITKYIPMYKKQYKDVFIETRKVKGRMPLMRAFYVSGQSQCIDIGNMKNIDELRKKLVMLLERSGELWIGRRRFRQGVIGVAGAVREIPSAMTDKSMHEVGEGKKGDEVIKYGLLSKGTKRVGNAKGRSEQGRGKTRHRNQNEREAETMEMVKQIGMKLKRGIDINALRTPSTIKNVAMTTKKVI